MSDIGTALGIAAPLYNIAMIIIVMGLFIKLFSRFDRFHSQPWKFLFIAICIFIVEEALTVVRHAGILWTPRWILALFEMAMIICFIYMLLVQKEYIKKFGEEYE